MNHDLLHYLEKLWFGLGVRPVCADARINGGDRVKFVFLLEEDKKVHVREPSLLEFDGEYFCDSSTEDPILEDVTKERFFLQVKNTGYKIGAV